ncbi:MAG: hypothetical protein HYR84_16820 [Planctomycetes bacterium]|nr:hypothetical protein [Planctomycetota bacterium]
MDDAVDHVRERADGLMITPGLGGSLLSEGLGADRFGAINALAGHAKAPGKKPIAGISPNRIGFARQQSLVHFEKMCVDNWSVGNDRIAAFKADVLAENDIVSRNYLGLAVANHLDSCLHENRELVEMPFGAKLLDQAERRVDDGHAADGEGALVFAENEQRDRRRRHHGIEPGEQVAAYDLEVIAPLGAWRAVDLAAGDALGHLGSGQPEQLGHGYFSSFRRMWRNSTRSV